MTPHESAPTGPIGVSVKQAAALTSISEWEIRDAINRGDIPAYRRGRRIVIDYAGLVAWLTSHPPVVDKSA